VQFSAGEFRFAVLVLTIAAFGLTYLSSRKGKQSVWSYLLLGYIIAMLVNVFIPHVPATLILRSYTPGVITAVLMNWPVMNLLAIGALQRVGSLARKRCDHSHWHCRNDSAAVLHRWFDFGNLKTADSPYREASLFFTGYYGRWFPGQIGP